MEAGDGLRAGLDRVEEICDQQIDVRGGSGLDVFWRRNELPINARVAWRPLRVRKVIDPGVIRDQKVNYPFGAVQRHLVGPTFALPDEMSLDPSGKGVARMGCISCRTARLIHASVLEGNLSSPLSHAC